ncbi:ABC transporter permease [Acetobacter peroxydans]|uniref:Spermidine/putrescine ABC transporter permease n=1 Tax=Acetobacter peroxydans TaxID=104098 RepID=A0A4Y3TWB9_9PROT|nr:ABC transporter permease [Acetobacter peroxydans]GBR33871.1 spermidine/putrescine ABC transporter permease [Acetobacter peroxydans NBRC 13755]GBR45017.1 spermidine/putrescine ABC transporter permease [Acetobacter peroxydans]GEB86044.1 spermidine/putrescine ABC transporter permease [Acetobacter peroxydans]
MRRPSRRESLPGLLFASPALLWLVAFFAAPLLAMVAVSLRDGTTGQYGIGNFVQVFTEKAYTDALFNSLTLTAVVTLASLVLAYPLAYSIASLRSARMQRLALTFAVLPFWTSYVVRSYAWLLVLAPTGPLNSVLLAIGLIHTPLRLAYSTTATEIGFVHFFIMLDTLTIYASLVQINPRLALAARDLGASALRTFLSVTLPLSLPGIAVGAFLTIVLCIGDYVTPQILGGMRAIVLPQTVMMQIQKHLDLPMASAMSLVLTVVMALAYLTLYRFLKTGEPGR